MRRHVMALGLAAVCAGAGPLVPARADGDDDALRALERETEQLVARIRAGVVGVTPKRGGAVRVLTADAGTVGAGAILGRHGERFEVLTSTDVIGAGVVAASLVTPDGRELDADVVGRDPAVGAVLLACTEDPGAPLALGRSAELRTGDRLCAAGSPYGSVHRVYEVAVSLGTLTGRYTATDHEPRRGPGDRYSGPVLETDAGINPGSFGGPLCDGRGRVVGLATSAISYVRWLGTSIPIDAIRAHLPALRAGIGREPAGLVGVGDTGCLIAPAVGEPGCVVLGAGTGGLQVGDVIAACNGTPVTDAAALAALLATTQTATTQLTVRRDGREVRVPWSHPAPPRRAEDF